MVLFDPFEEHQEYLRRLWDYRQGEDDARFGNPKRSYGNMDYSEGYEKMYRFCRKMEEIIDKNNQLMKRIDAVKKHEFFLG